MIREDQTLATLWEESCRGAGATVEETQELVDWIRDLTAENERLRERLAPPRSRTEAIVTLVRSDSTSTRVAIPIRMLNVATIKRQGVLYENRGAMPWAPDGAYYEVSFHDFDAPIGPTGR